MADLGNTLSQSPLDIVAIRRQVPSWRLRRPPAFSPFSPKNRQRRARSDRQKQPIRYCGGRDEWASSSPLGSGRSRSFDRDMRPCPGRLYEVAPLRRLDGADVRSLRSFRSSTKGLDFQALCQMSKGKMAYRVQNDLTIFFMAEGPHGLSIMP